MVGPNVSGGALRFQLHCTENLNTPLGHRSKRDGGILASQPSDYLEIRDGQGTRGGCTKIMKKLSHRKPTKQGQYLKVNKRPK